MYSDITNQSKRFVRMYNLARKIDKEDNEAISSMEDVPIEFVLDTKPVFDHLR
jgi:hypothetical protein